MKRILLIGPSAHMGGPAIKNRILIEHLKRAHDIKVWNTYDRSLKARIGAVCAILFAREKYIIVSVSRKGRNLLYPVLLLKSKISRVRYVCIVIGGNVIGSFKAPGTIKTLAKADLVTVETKGLYQQMKEYYHLNNLYWMPNYKEDLAHQVRRLPAEHFDAEELRFLFLSSMRDAKGVETLLNAFTEVLAQGYRAQLDYYGPIKKDMNPDVLARIEQSEGIRYCGLAANDQVLETMSHYHVFVFPTEYTGEGFPAVLVEAQAAGLPVISSDMNDNAEIIREGHNGWIFPHGDEAQLVEKIKYCIDHRDALKQISHHNSQDAITYDAGKVINAFCAALKDQGWPL